MSRSNLQAFFDQDVGLGSFQAAVHPLADVPIRPGGPQRGRAGSADLPFLALFLGLHVFRLLAPASDFHPLAGFYARPGVIDGRSPVYVAPGLELKPCQRCGKCIHPGAQQCSYCDARYPFGEA